MGNKVTFLVGLAIGYVVGARAGRERYEQMKKTATQVVQSPPVQKATQTAGAKATQLTKAAKDKAATQVPKITETAKNSASKVRGQFDRIPGLHSADSGADSAADLGPDPVASAGTDGDHATVNGTRPVE